MLWLPTTKKELDTRGWDEVDVILFTGDAYVDHPSFGVAVIGRLLESEGYRVAIVPQPNWRDDLRDFRKLGRPRLFFGISAGNMDSMVNHYTANKRLRSDDAFTPDARSDMRPDYPTVVYTKILKELYPDVPVVIGGIEASLRRVVHYDYWEDRLRPSILLDSGADLLVYGQGELPIVEVADRLKSGNQDLTGIRQTSYIVTERPDIENLVELHSYEDCLTDKRKQAANFKEVEVISNQWTGVPITQKQQGRFVVIEPPFPTLSTEQLDRSFELPYTRLPHPRYRGKTIPAYEMIKHSVNIHRGCFGGCSFCTISAHQGKFIASRSERSVLEEVEKIVQMDDFKGYISDLGGPSANMYQMGGIDEDLCLHCRRPSCIYPKVCRNLNYDHRPLLNLYQKVKQIPQIKKAFVSSGLRYDLMLHQGESKVWNDGSKKYIQTLIEDHVSGRLKVAPEHTSSPVLELMRKPSFDLFLRFNRIFETINQELGLRQQLIPYFISSHPACKEADMAELAVETKSLNFRLEHVQDFTPTPMTLSSEIYYTGINPYTGESVFTAKTQEEKRQQRSFFFWYDQQYRKPITEALKRIGRTDLLDRLYSRVNKK